jgi:hypothetical protein
MKKTGFLSPSQKKTIRVILLVYFFSLFNVPILIHAQTDPNVISVQEEISVWGTDVNTEWEEPVWQMCLVPEEKIVSCDGTSMLIQGYQMITCNDACGPKSGITIPLIKIDEATYCLKDKTCGQAIKDYCNGLIDAKINQWPRTVQTVTPLHCTDESSNNNNEWTNNNNEEFDDVWTGKHIPEKAVEEHEWWIVTYYDYSCCGATINAEKPLGQAIESQSFTCTSDCKYAWRTLAFDQKFKAENDCNTPEECQQAMQSACNRCDVTFDWDEISVDSTFDPLRPEIGKTAADYVAETMTKFNSIAWLFKQQETKYNLWNWLKQIIGDDAYNKFFWEWADSGILWDIAQYGEYAILALQLLEWDFESIALTIVTLWLQALWLWWNAQQLIDNPILFGIQVWLSALNGIFPWLWIVANALFSYFLNVFPWFADFIDQAGEVFKDIFINRRLDPLKSFFWRDTRNMKFICDMTCWTPNAWKEMKLKDVEEKTGCAWAKNCADEFLSYCQWNELVHKSQLVENCHNCDTKILNENNQELIPWEREHDDFMDMQYQCSGEWCSEEPWVIVSAEKIHSMYNCSETELEKQCEAEGRENEDECYQACIEESAQKFCMGMAGDFVATAECTAIHDKSRWDDEFYCSAWCWLRQNTEIMEDYLIDKYNCNDITSCLYYAKIECMNPGYAKNKDESIKIAETTKFCVADLFEPTLGSNYYKCASVCVHLHEEKDVEYFEDRFGCDGRWCQKYADERCGEDRTESSCRISENNYLYNCELWCKKTPNTAIWKSYLKTNYNCQWDACKALAQQFCEDTIPEPECNVGKWWDGDWTVADHYLCGAGCEKPEHLQVMKWDLAKQLWCNEDGREWCRQTAIDYCDNKHPGVTISDKSKIGIAIDKWIQVVGEVPWLAQILQDWLKMFNINIPIINASLDFVENLSNQILWWYALYGQIYHVATSDWSNRDEVIANLYIINNFYGNTKNFIDWFKKLTFAAPPQAKPWECAAWFWWVDVDADWNLTPWTKEKIGFLWKVVGKAIQITQVFAPDAMKKLWDSIFWWWWNWWWNWDWWWNWWWGLDAYTHNGTIPVFWSCPELDIILAATNPSAWEHGSASSYWYTIDQSASCSLKQTLMEAYCENTLPTNYKAEQENDIIKIIRTDIEKDDLVCSDPFRRDCNPFEQWDEFLVEIYEPVIVPDNDPVKAPGNCRDGIQNHGETGLDCGEVCGTCCDGSRLWCREKVASNISCSSFYDNESCHNIWCEWIVEIDPYDDRIETEYCAGTPQICSFSDKTSCNADPTCLRWCDSDLIPKNWN